jgi:Ca2+-binding EF-hand superfamily protein
MIKVGQIMKDRYITASEVFNSCDSSHDGFIEIEELARFIQGLSPQFKNKEAHAMMHFLDIDNSGTIDKNELESQLATVEKKANQSSVSY